MTRIGAQCSIAPGFRSALEEAHHAGLNTIQVFSRSPVGGQTKGLPPRRESLSILQATDIAPVFVHAPYFVNPAALDAGRHQRAVKVLREELDRTWQLAGTYLVMHPGHRASSDTKSAMARLIETLGVILGHGPVVLLENAAGQGKEIGDQFADLGDIFKTFGGSDLGLMLDTAHAMAAGYPLASAEDWKALVEQMDHFIGIHRVRAIHLNDNAYPVGGRRDRHAHLFEGPLGYGAVQALVEDSVRYQWPIILETPGSNGMARSDDVLWVKKLLARIDQPQTH